MGDTTAPRTVSYLPLATLQQAADDRNPKAHDLDRIEASFGRFGLIDPVGLDDRTGKIIGGHGRVKALARMRDRGVAPPDGVQLDGDGGWLIPTVVGWASRGDLDAAGALIALNRTTELGGWADDALLDLLDDLAADDALDGAVGFDDADLDQLRSDLDRWDDDRVPGFAPTDETERIDSTSTVSCPSCGASIDLQAGQVVE